MLDQQWIFWVSTRMLLIDVLWRQSMLQINCRGHNLWFQTFRVSSYSAAQKVTSEKSMKSTFSPRWVISSPGQLGFNVHLQFNSYTERQFT